MNMSIPRFVVAIGVGFFICAMSSCLPDAMTREANRPFFDLTGFIKQSIADSHYVTVNKTVDIGGVSETKEIKDYAFWDDLKRFESFDINRPALYDKYVVDTLEENNYKVYRHTAKDPKMHVQSMEIRIEEDDIVKIDVRSQSQSFLENLDILFTWIPEETYSYQKWSDKLFSEREEQKVTVTFLK